MKTTRLRWAGLDSLTWMCCVVLATWLRFDFRMPGDLWAPTMVTAVCAVALQLIAGYTFGPYSVGHELGSFEEIHDVAKSTLMAGLGLAAVVLFTSLDGVPRSVPFVSTAFALTTMLAARFTIRSRRTSQQNANGAASPVLIFGAGSGGRMLVRSLVRDPSSGYIPAALLDDDPTKARLHFDGVKVRGTRHDMAELAQRYDASTVIIAIPSASAETMRELSSIARRVGLKVLVLPPVRDIIGGTLQASDLRNLDVADLLGRQPVALDTSSIVDSIAGKRVLVTGAGGSIGSELCRQIAKFGPARLALLDRDESGLHGAQLSIDGQALLDDGTLILCDIREAESVQAAFERERPDVVFHAAALKHLTLLEQFPAEAVKTNVHGTLNVLRAARSVGVATFINISTDKAAQPTCILGYSKRVAERLTAEFDAQAVAGRYISVRFGNVLGSRGSVLLAFTEQIRRGGPVTVTHPEVERFFMLIPEACQLVLQAGAIGTGGEVMVLEMGAPVKIVEVARTLIEMSGRTDIDIVYTGLRPGEKLSERLFTPGEHIRRSSHPLISLVAVPGMRELELDSVSCLSDQHSRDWLKRHGDGQVQLISQ